MNDNVKYWAAFNCIPGIGRVRLTQLENYFGNLENAWKASAADIKQAGLDSVALRAIAHWRPSISPEAEMEKLDRCRVKLLTCNDSGYPSRLKQVSTMNYVLVREARQEYRVIVD
ncbi:hypothetical protein ACFLV0_00325 [Chloroflexota bacterium]